MIKKTFNTGEFLFVTVPEDAGAFVVDNAMQYLVFKVPDKKKCEAIELKLFQDPETFIDVDECYKTGGVKLPEGKFSLLGKAFRLESQKAELIGVNNLLQTMAKENLKAKETLILQKVEIGKELKEYIARLKVIPSLKLNFI